MSTERETDGPFTLPQPGASRPETWVFTDWAMI